MFAISSNVYCFALDNTFLTIINILFLMYRKCFLDTGSNKDIFCQIFE